MMIGQRIKNRRRELGLTQKQLGELCGMADSAIRKYESGRITPKHQTLKKIADALKVPIYDLIEANFPVVPGRWEVYNKRESAVQCSNCGLILESVAEVFSYCPNCGKKMDGGNYDGN